MKRIERKHLKEDEFVSTIGIVIHFLKEQSKKVAAAGVALLLILCAFFIVHAVKNQNAKKESALLAQILQARENLNSDPAKIAELEKLSGNTKFSRLAYVELGTYWFEKGELDKAQAALEHLSSSRKDFIYYQAQDLLARILIQKKEYDKAIAICTQIEKDSPKDYSIVAALFHKAQALEEKGDFAKALALYSKIQEEHSQTYYGMDAAQKVRKLGGEKQN